MSAAKHPKAKGKDPKKVAAGKKGGKMSRARNRDAVQAARMKEIMQWRLKGLSFAEIGRKVGLTQTPVRELYYGALEAERGETALLAERERAEQLHKTKKVETRLLGLLLNEKLKVNATKPDGQVMELADFEALNKLSVTLMKVLDRRAKLTGADMPDQVEEVNKGEGLNLDRLKAIVAAKLKGQGE